MDRIEDRKKLLSTALNQSFVDDYSAYRNIVNNINDDFKTLSIDYEWTYDEFCVKFLDESMAKLEESDIFKFTNFKDFYSNFWNFNLVVIREIIINKFEELDYDYSKYESLINSKNYIDSQHIKN